MRVLQPDPKRPQPGTRPLRELLHLIQTRPLPAQRRRELVHEDCPRESSPPNDPALLPPHAHVVPDGQDADRATGSSRCAVLLAGQAKVQGVAAVIFDDHEGAGESSDQHMPYTLKTRRAHPFSPLTSWMPCRICLTLGLANTLPHTAASSRPGPT